MVWILSQDGEIQKSNALCVIIATMLMIILLLYVVPLRLIVVGCILILTSTVLWIMVATKVGGRESEVLGRLLCMLSLFLLVM